MRDLIERAVCDDVRRRGIVEEIMIGKSRALQQDQPTNSQIGLPSARRCPMQRIVPILSTRNTIVVKWVGLERGRGGEWASSDPKDHASDQTVRLLDFHAQEEDVSGAAQDRTAEFAAQSHSLRPTSVR
jgi:hypothetical protein